MHKLIGLVVSFVLFLQLFGLFCFFEAFFIFRCTYTLFSLLCQIINVQNYLKTFEEILTIYLIILLLTISRLSFIKWI